MTVFVDDFRTEARVGRVQGHWSHLVTDNPDIEELHRFADRIGLRRSWFQPGEHLYRPHYDVTDTKRCEALAAGAVEICYRDMPDVLRRAREASNVEGS